MLELSNRLSEKSIKSEEASNLSSNKLFDVDQAVGLNSDRIQKMLNRSPLKATSDTSQLLQGLQDRFACDDTLPNSIPSDIEALIEAQVEIRTQELFRQANYDSLTHLPNRAYFHTTLESLVVNANQTEGEFTLLFLDLDGFKNINDTFGHHTGDELLRNVSARVISAVRDGDVVSRLGGDEFVVLLAGELTRDNIENICRRIISEVRRVYWIDQNEIQISTSIGVACYPMDAKSSTELVEKSDKALYASKGRGRNTFSFYSDLVACEQGSDCHVLKRLESALKNGKINVCFEPQVDLASQKIVGSSVTALWMETGLDSPYLNGWMDTLNQSDLACSTGAWLIDSALYYLQQWQVLNDALVISIPMVSALCKAEDMVKFMNERLASYQVNRAQIQLEFSLPSVMEAAVQTQLNALSEAGYQITLTEVGKTPLDLALLSELNLQEMKLDAKWLKKSLSTVAGQKCLKAVVQMANVLDTAVIATGVESQKELEPLQHIGCSMGQGLYWALPLEADGFYKALRSDLPAVH